MIECKFSHPAIANVCSNNSVSYAKLYYGRLMSALRLLGLPGDVNVDTFAWHSLTHYEVDQIKTLAIYYNSEIKKVNSILVAIKQICEECCRIGMMTVDNWLSIESVEELSDDENLGIEEKIKHVKNLRSEYKKIDAWLALSIQNEKDSGSRYSCSTRNRAMFAVIDVLGSYALVSNLKISDYNLKGVWTVVNKKRKFIRFTDRVTDLINEWIVVRPDQDSEWLFTTVNENYSGEKLVSSAIYSAIQRIYNNFKRSELI